MAQRVGRGIALLFHDHGTRRGWVVNSTPWPHFTPGKDPVPIVQEAGWAPGLVWTGGKSRPHRDLIPDHPACSQSLYQLSYPAHFGFIVVQSKPVAWSRLMIFHTVSVAVWVCCKYRWPRKAHISLCDAVCNVTRPSQLFLSSVMGQEVLQYQNHCPSTSLCRYICLQLRAEMSSPVWKENEQVKNNRSHCCHSPGHDWARVFFYGLQVF